MEGNKVKERWSFSHSVQVEFDTRHVCRELVLWRHVLAPVATNVMTRPKWKEQKRGQNGRNKSAAKMQARAYNVPSKCLPWITQPLKDVSSVVVVVVIIRARLSETSFKTHFDLHIFEAVNFSKLDESGDLQGTARHSLSFSDTIPNGQKYYAQNHEYDDGDVEGLGLNLRLHVESAMLRR